MGRVAPTVDANAFVTTKGNNHDSILFVEPELEYPYHLIISHTPQYAHLWRTRSFMSSSIGSWYRTSIRSASITSMTTA